MVEDMQSDGEGRMTGRVRARRADPAAARPLVELLACSSDAGSLLTASAQTLAFEAGQTIFRQASACEGLYLVVQGQLQRRSDRLETRITLGLARPGDLVELAAALGDLRHTYSLVAQTSGLLLQLPLDALQRAFESYPPLRMRLLEELAREVSRAYTVCCRSWWARTRNGHTSAA
jgi:CRP-like cAMP-binding protein